jgi:hypothetical protein
MGFSLPKDNKIRVMFLMAQRLGEILLPGNVIHQLLQAWQLIFILLACKK